jgi:plastocyanin
MVERKAPKPTKDSKGAKDAKGAGLRLWGCCAVVVLVSLAPMSLSAEPLTGRVEVRSKVGASAAQAVVYAEPLDGAAPTPGGTVSITQKNKTFIPRALGVPLGSTVEFPNADGIFHNVFSLSSPQPFDLGLYRSGSSKSRTFSKPAVYHVFCNIHPQMAAFIVVAPSAWVTTASSDGAWRLDVPPGRYRVTALSERAAPVSTEVRVGDVAAPTVLTLDESRFVPTQHLNKFGKPYPKEAYKEGR